MELESIIKEEAAEKIASRDGQSLRRSHMALNH
jgi:hypothetical protein